MPQQENFEARQAQQNTQFEARLTRALERRPRVAIPENFAARVASSLPPHRPRRRIVPVRKLALGAAALASALAMFAVAPHAAPSFTNLAFDVELMLLAELFGSVYGLIRRSS